MGNEQYMMMTHWHGVIKLVFCSVLQRSSSFQESLVKSQETAHLYISDPDTNRQPSQLDSNTNAFIPGPRHTKPHSK